jgi:hypothetical protein
LPLLEGGEGRTKLCRVMLHPHDAADLDRLAAAWSCSRPTAAWLVLRSSLGKWRGQAPHLGPLGLEAAASAGALGLAIPPGLRRPSAKRGQELEDSAGDGR